MTAALRALMAHAQIDAGFRAHRNSNFLQRRRGAPAVITERAEARGELPPTVSWEAVADIVFGVLWYRLLTDRPPDEQLTGELVAAVTHVPPIR